MAFYLHDTYTLLLIYSILVSGFLMFNHKNRLSFLLEHPVNQKYSLRYHRKDSVLFKFFMMEQRFFLNAAKSLFFLVPPQYKSI